MTRYLVAADPALELHYETDTTLRIIAEALRIGIEVDYLDLDAHDYQQNNSDYLSKLPVTPVLACDPTTPDFIRLGPPRLAYVAEYDAIMQRKDPPVDESYRGHAAQFAKAPAHILQLNDPTASVRFFEKELAQRYSQYSVPTTYCTTADETIAAVRAVAGDEAVIKPSNLFGGIGIGFFKRTASADEITAHFAAWKPCFVQPYIPEIATIGDLRVMSVNQRVIGSVLRVPAPGSRLGNLKQGASAAYFKPTPRQLEACAFIAKDLAPMGLHFIGFDFIGDYLTEVNITCPTGVPQSEQVSGEPVGARLLEEIEKLRVAKRRTDAS